MTTEPDQQRALNAIEEWFASRGFGVVTHREGEVVWADLVRGEGRVVAPRYGRGTTSIEAAESARHRYEIEQ